MEQRAGAGWWGGVRAGSGQLGPAGCTCRDPCAHPRALLPTCRPGPRAPSSVPQLPSLQQWPPQTGTGPLPRWHKVQVSQTWLPFSGQLPAGEALGSVQLFTVWFSSCPITSVCGRDCQGEVAQELPNPAEPGAWAASLPRGFGSLGHGQPGLAPGTVSPLFTPITMCGPWWVP